LIDRKE